MDLFQSLKDEESNDNEGTSLKSISESEDQTFPTQKISTSKSEDSDPEAGPSDEKKMKLDKQNRKEIEEEEREKML